MLVGAAQFSHATPQIMRIDGSIFDSTGLPVAASKDIQITAYDAASGGSLLWTSAVYNTPVSAGRFTINLEASSGSPTLVSRLAERTASQAIYFQIEVDSGTTNGTMDSATLVRPRIRAKGTAFALSAASADSIKGVTASATELNFLAGVTGNVQLQLDGRVLVNQLCAVTEYLRGFDASGNKVCLSLPGNVTVTQAEAGATLGCALLSDSTVVCSGANAFSGLGDGSTIQRLAPVYVRATDGSKLSGVSQVAAGYYSVCALKSDGTVWCWGYNGYGNVGNNSTTSTAVPVQVLSGASDISYGMYEVCARKTNGTAWCWGRNNNGQLGDGTQTDRWTPVQVIGVTNAVSVNSGGSHSCAVLSDSTVKCWGYNGYGNLGDGTTNLRTTPTLVTGLSGVTALSRFKNNSSHSGPNTCVIKSNGTLWCWGYNGYGQLGLGDTNNRYTATQVTSITTAVKAASSSHHTCVILSDGSMKCVGYNGYGNLGTGDTNGRYTYTAVTGVGASNVTSVGANADTSANWTNFVSGGRLYNVGANDSGQWGNNTSTSNAANTTIGASQTP